jgi:ribonucleoside-triphosphate reductase (thioredoxin)
MSKMDEYQRFIALSRYARYQDDLSRRESWEETVDRYINYWREKEVGIHKDFSAALDEARDAIVNLEVMPSMRALMTAGVALDKDNVAGYNCAYTAIDNIKKFDEILYILMCGTGVGYSVERKYIDQLPAVAEEFHDTDTTIRVADSKIGWAKGYRQLIRLLYAGDIPKWDLSAIRPAGERLKTFGGRASGPAPLDDLFRFTCEIFRGAAGRRLTSLEAHDILCKIASVVVVGGVRRSALISLSNLTDTRLRNAKTGDFPAYRYLANNSVVYTEKPDPEVFMEEWLSLYRSRSGERGIFNRKAAVAQVKKFGRRSADYDFGCNPCSEIILRSNQFCNLTEVVVRPEDTMDSLERKVRIATFLGTLQSTLTDFRYLSKEWRRNCEEERLLGVSLTGIADHKILGDPHSKFIKGLLGSMRLEAVKENKKWAEALGINQSSAITCVKPSGTVSQLVNSASGIHARYAPYYIRRVRADEKDPLAIWMEKVGYPVEWAVGSNTTKVFSFPQKAPEKARCEGDLTSLEQLELWKIYQDFWCEHKPSITVHYSPDEFLDIGAWVYKHIDEISGIAFLPKDDHVYQQAPYEKISKEEYEALVASMPDVDWETFVESYDNTTASQELACSGGVCEVVDLK